MTRITIPTADQTPAASQPLLAAVNKQLGVVPNMMKLIGNSQDNLFHLRTNLRYGCTILRHYLDIEKGDYFRALGRYNGSLGQAEYPNIVRAAWEKQWRYNPNLAQR